MKVVVPMAGRGSRFANQGFQIPKPLIEVAGKPMVLRSLKSIEGLEISEVIFVVLSEHDLQFSASSIISRNIVFPHSFIFLEDVTEGQLCTVMAAREQIDGLEDVLVIASDTYVEGSLAKDIRQNRSECAGLISVMDMPGDRWSFVKTNASGNAMQVVEKVRISNLASTGIYYFSEGRQFVEYAETMIINKEKTKGEYFVIPVYQKMIDDGLTVKVTQADSMWDMGTPEAKSAFETHLQNMANSLQGQNV